MLIENKRLPCVHVLAISNRKSWICTVPVTGERQKRWPSSLPALNQYILLFRRRAVFGINAVFQEHVAKRVRRKMCLVKLGVVIAIVDVVANYTRKMHIFQKTDHPKKPPSCKIQIFTDLKLRLATATHNFKSVIIIFIECLLSYCSA